MNMLDSFALPLLVTVPTESNKQLTKWSRRMLLLVRFELEVGPLLPLCQSLPGNGWQRRGACDE